MKQSQWHRYKYDPDQLSLTTLRKFIARWKGRMGKEKKIARRRKYAAERMLAAVKY